MKWPIRLHHYDQGSTDQNRLDKDQDKIGNLGPDRIRINKILKIWDKTGCLWIPDCDSIYNHKL